MERVLSGDSIAVSVVDGAMYIWEAGFCVWYR